MTAIEAKAEAFHALHHGDSAFIIPNPWDAGSARILAHLGFAALATTSMGYAFSLGRPDGSLSRAQTLANARDIALATALPVSADLENGFGDRPEDVTETIRLAGVSGIVGGSIEDSSGRKDDPIYDLDLAVARIRAAVAAARALPFKFTLTARAENYLHGRPDLGDTITRLKAYEKAGADVLYAPGLRRREDIEAVVKALTKPVNVVMGLSLQDKAAGAQLTQADLSGIGVKRISVGSSLCRVALAAFVEAARGMAEKGSFAYNAAPPKEFTEIFNSFGPNHSSGARE